MNLHKRAKRSREACQVIQQPNAAYDEITRLRAENEALWGRVAELEEAGANAARHWSDAQNGYQSDELMEFREVVDGNSGAWLLRKQAEAVVKFVARYPRMDAKALEEHGDLTVARETLERDAQRLRQQATDAEKAGEL